MNAAQLPTSPADQIVTKPSRPPARHLFMVALAAVAITSATYAQNQTVRVDLKLRTGGALSGLVVDHTEHGVVIVHESTPYVFAWDELEAGSAYAAKRALLALTRGEEKRLSADDHLQLGLFALSVDRKDLAAKEFHSAKKIDPSYKSRIDGAVEQYRQHEAAANVGDNPLDEPVGTGVNVIEPSDMTEATEAECALPHGIALAPLPSKDGRRRVLEAYKTFGAKVQEVLGKDVVLLESDHFLIWTDWEPRLRDKLLDWCESMYATLCRQFDLDADREIFLAKCPVFCWRSKGRFLKFARDFDGYAGTEAVGYTRSIEQNGHVHVVLLRQGPREADLNRFACTLVHEGTHAFLHRLYSSRLIPHWVNEGYADLMAERILKQRCPNGENAALLAKQFARYEWPIGDLLRSVGPIEVHQYPLAHSVVAHLEAMSQERFAGFIRNLKEGRTAPAALAANYDGMTIDQLEASWRSATRAANASIPPPAGGPCPLDLRD